MLYGNMTSLVKLCIDFIVENFEHFNYAFNCISKPKDENLLRNFEFLQRRFSVELATALYENKKLKEEYFNFLINEHLNFLDGRWLKNSRYMNSLEDIFCRLPNLTRICFSPCGDEILEYLAKFCPKIVEIDVRHSNITDIGVEYLCKSENGIVPCPELKRIFIKPSRITSKGIKCLIRNLPSLERIDYSVPLLLYRVHEECLSHSQKAYSYNLVELNLLKFSCLPTYSGILKTCLTQCPKLESLACYISNEEELDLFTNIHLKKLHLQFPIAEPTININNFLKVNGSNLTYLKISDCVISVSLLAVHCPVLKEFFAHRVNFTDEVCNLQPILPYLVECTFSHIDPSVSKAVCLLISSSPILQSLSFTYCILSREVQAQILMWCKNPSAKKIDFWCLDLEIEFVKNILLSCPSLKDMALTECFFDVYGTEMMEILENLQNLAKTLPNKPKIVFFELFN